jgi:predicted DNA-binding transcriptional regulator YafY
MLIKQIEHLEKIDKLIRERRTGTPDEFAQKVGISRRQLYNYLDELRSYGVDVCYSRVCQSFGYKNNKRLRVYFNCEEIEESKGTQFAGGYHFFVSKFYLPSFYNIGKAI